MQRTNFLAAFGFFLVAGSVAAQDSFVFRDVHVVPMGEEQILRGYTVVVSGEHIDAMGPTQDVAIPEGAQVIDGGGRYLLPGLAEMHAHVPGDSDQQYLEEVLFLYVANGVTTARGMLGQPAHLELRDRLERHEVLGPRLYTSGPSLSGQSVSSPEDARRMVMEQAEAGYDFIKIHPGLTRAEYDAAAEAADEVGIDLAGHVPADVGLARALEVGQVTIDHLDGYVEYLLPADSEAQGGFFGLGIASQADAAAIPAAAEATRAADVWNVPTQSLIEHMAAPSPSADELAARPEMAYVSPAQREQWINTKRQIMGAPMYSPEEAEELVEVRRSLIKALHEAGAGLLLGSDAPQVFNVPGFAIHHELAMVVAAGLSPYEALRTGTVSPAVFFGAEDVFGRVVQGAQADLLLVDGNPLEDIGAVAHPAGVMVRGRWLDRQALDAGLEEIAARHRD